MSKVLSIYLLEDDDGFIKFVDVNISTFDPHFFQSSWDIRNRVHGLEGGAGIMPEELRVLCVQCVRCGNLVTRTSQEMHRCPVTNQTFAVEGDEDFWKSSEYRLDAVGTEGWSLNGITNEEFQGLFWICMTCDHVLSSSGRDRHVCPSTLKGALARNIGGERSD